MINTPYPILNHVIENEEYIFRNRFNVGLIHTHLLIKIISNIINENVNQV